MHRCPTTVLLVTTLMAATTAPASADSASPGPGASAGEGAIVIDLPDNLLVPLEYSTIQAAVDAAVDGDVIIVDSGHYLENVVIDGKSVAIHGSGSVVVWPALDAPVFVIEDTPDDGMVTLRGLILRDPDDFDFSDFVIPDGDDEDEFSDGAGIRASNARLEVVECQLVGLRAMSAPGRISRYNGGAISSFNSDLILHRTALCCCESLWGGAVWAYGGTLEATQCTIFWNDADEGGAMHLQRVDAVLSQCEFSNNEASADAAHLNLLGGSLAMSRCSIRGDVPQGSAVRAGKDVFMSFVFPPQITVEQCRFETEMASVYAYLWYQDSGPEVSMASSTICGLDQCAGVAESPSELAMLEACYGCGGDTDFSGQVDIDDLVDMLMHWGEADPFTNVVDPLDGIFPWDYAPGETNTDDLVISLTLFGGCTSAAP